MEQEYILRIRGCDDHTKIYLGELKSEEFLFLKNLCEESERASTYGCMPTMALYTTEEYKKEYSWEDEMIDEDNG